MQKKIALISLGCAKNLINSEQMLSLIDEAGFELVSDPDGADAAIVNTCGFIEVAKQEAIDEIIGLGYLKEDGHLGKIIVTGCLSQRYQTELTDEMPEIDALVGTASYADIVSVLNDTFDGKNPAVFGDIDAPDAETGRIVSTGPSWAYLKIAEGCSNRCSYCVIPSLRGAYRSRPMENILEEAEALAQSGIRELIVVAQDITRYGEDLYGKRRLPELIHSLCAIDGIKWIRLHYLYPDELDDELIDTVAGEEKVLKYLDIPIQHINDGVLKLMNRRGTGDEIRALFKKLRERIPGVVLRTSIIAGLPGEGEAEFDPLSYFYAVAAPRMLSERQNMSLAGKKQKLHSTRFAYCGVFSFVLRVRCQNRKGRTGRPVPPLRPDLHPRSSSQQDRLFPQSHGIWKVRFPRG